MPETKSDKDSFLQFFIIWIISISIFILLIAMSGHSGSFTDFEALMLFGSILVGSCSYLFAFISALRQNNSYYLWSLLIGFVLFFYVLFQIGN